MDYIRKQHQTLPTFQERESVQPITTNEEQEEVMVCYQEFARRGNGMVERSDAQWHEMIFKNALCYAYRHPSSGEIEGYLTFRYKPHNPEVAFVSTDLEVWDLVYNSRRALHGLLGFLSAQRDQVKNITLSVQNDLPLEHLLTEPIAPDGKRNWLLGAETATLGSSLQGRIVSLRRTLMSVGKLGEASGAINLKLSDSLNSNNNENITIELNKGKIEIVKNKSASVSLATDIAVFASLFWGAISINDALLLGLVELDGKGDMSFLKQMFSVPRPMCIDYF